MDCSRLVCCIASSIEFTSFEHAWHSNTKCQVSLLSYHCHTYWPSTYNREYKEVKIFFQNYQTRNFLNVYLVAFSCNRFYQVQIFPQLEKCQICQDICTLFTFFDLEIAQTKKRRNKHLFVDFSVVFRLRQHLKRFLLFQFLWPGWPFKVTFVAV